MEEGAGRWTTCLIDLTSLPMNRLTLPMNRLIVPMDQLTVPIDPLTVPIDPLTVPIDLPRVRAPFYSGLGDRNGL